MPIPFTHTVPDFMVPDITVPDTTVPSSAVPDITVPSSAVPAFTVLVSQDFSDAPACSWSGHGSGHEKRTGAGRGGWLLLGLLLGLLSLLQPGTLAAADVCGTPSLQYLDGLLDEARRRILLVEFSEARSLLDEAQACLSRLDGVATPNRLGRLFQDLGATRLQLGDSQGANEAFRRASVIAPEIRWEARLGTKAMSPYLTLKEDVLLSPRRVLLFPALIPGAEAALDGIPITPGQQRTSFPGTHLLQVREAEGKPWIGFLLDVPATDPTMPLPNAVVGRVFRQGQLRFVVPGGGVETAFTAGPNLFVRRVTAISSIAFLAGGGALLAVSLSQRAQVLAGDYESFDAGEALLQSANTGLAVGLGLGAGGLLLSGASLTMTFGYRPPQGQGAAP